MVFYQHCSEQHLQRYVDEFAFRHSHRSKVGIEDAQRAVLAMQGGEGKRLMLARAEGRVTGGVAAPLASVSAQS